MLSHVLFKEAGFNQSTAMFCIEFFIFPEKIWAGFLKDFDTSPVI